MHLVSYLFRLFSLILETIWLLLPAYTPNNFAVVFGGGKPLDLGRKFVDGRRILGDGKTFRGFIFGFFGGVFTAHIELLVENMFGLKLFSSLLYLNFLELVSLMSFGSLFGDCVGSFIKRRFKVERGEKFPLLDQYDFFIFFILFASFCSGFWRLFSIQIILTGVILTPILHRLINVFAYKIGLKDVPW